MPATSNEGGAGVPDTGCSTCGSGGGETDAGSIRISIGVGSDTVNGDLTVNGSVDFSANLASVHTLSLSSFGFSNVLGGDVSTLTAGTRQVKNRAGDVMATLLVETTAAASPATDLQSITLTVTPAAGSSQPVSTHTFEKVASTGDFTGVGIKYTRTEGSNSEFMAFYNSGAGTTGVAADGTVYGSFKTVDTNGDVQIWTAMSESAAFTWNATQGKWTGDLTEMLEFIPAATGQPTVITERHYARIGNQSADQSAKVVTSETVTTKLGTTVLDEATTLHGYYESYYKSGTVVDSRFGQERWQVDSTGSWTLTVRGYVPDSASPDLVETLQITPWLDGPSGAGSLSTTAAAETFFTALASQATGGNPQIAGCQITRSFDASEITSGTLPPWSKRDISLINGVVTGTSYEFIGQGYLDNAYALPGDNYLYAQSRSERWNGAGTQVAWSESFESEDGSMSANVDQTYVASLSSKATLTGGLTAADSWRRVVSEDNTYGTLFPVYAEGAMFPLWSTTTSDSDGRTLSETSKFSESGTTIQSIATTYAGETGYTRSAGDLTLSSQGDDVVAGGLRTSTSTDILGITTTTVTDETTGEMVSETRLGLTTNYTKATGTDGSTTQTVTQTADETTRTVSVTVTDAQGRTVSSTDANSGVTTYSYASNGRTVTQTLPGGGTQITENYLDGQLKSITGTAVTPEYHSYTVNDGGDASYEAGSITETVYYGNDSSAAWRKTTTNYLGQVLREEAPSPTGTGVSVTLHTYNAKGQRVKTSSPGMADMIIAYDDWGRVSQQGYDMDADGELTVSSNDVLSTSSTDYVTGEGTVLEQVVRLQYTQDGADTTLQTKTERKLLEGSFWQRSTQADGGVFTQFDVLSGSIRTVHGQQSVTGTQSQIQIYQNDLLMSETPPGMTSAVTYTYDGFGQVATVVHPLNGTTTRTYDTAGRVLTQRQTGGDTVTYAYNTQGQVTSETHSDSSTTSYTYDVQGHVLTQGGTAGYPLGYEYDAMGRLWKLHTSRGVGTDDVTTWTYAAASGVLVSKTDAADRSVGYTYDAAGRVLTRAWQRGVTTTYSYDAMGRQTGIDYSDSTPDVSITYDRAGRRVSTTDAAGTHAYAYDDATSGGQVSGWSVSGTGAWSGLSVGYGNTAGKRSSRATSLGSITLPTVNYTYETGSGRMAGVSASDFSVSYGYDAATGWNSGVTYTSGLSSARTADALGRLDAITWSVGGATVSGHDYTLNALNRRTAAQRQDGSTWSYGYNARGEITSAAKGTEPGKQFAFAYDGIGNRTISSVSSIASTTTLRTTGYSANALNQYDSITHPQPGWLVLRGSANTAAGTTVTIDGNAPTLTTGTLWFYEQSVDNTEGPVRREVEITATRSDGGINNGPVTTQQKGTLFIPPPTEVPTYDLDGNLTSDARWNYVWNGENRLAAQEEKTGFIVQPTSSTLVKRIRLEFDYDAQGRRVSKRTFIATGSGGFVLKQSLVELYDGWNMIAEIDATSSAQLSRSYEWGMDISGTMDGAGGVGGLLIERFHTAPVTVAHAPCYDGNGNVTELVNLANGNVTARYEYGSFGETISMDGGALAEANPFRFSTKYLDEETGLYNYGYRYCDAVKGGWLSRDPIGERGGVNLYGMCENDSLNQWDYMGLRSGSNPKRYTLSLKDKGGWLGLCGHFRYDIEWHVTSSGSGPINGTVYQEGKRKVYLYPCTPKGADKAHAVLILDEKFKEAWSYPLKSGDTWGSVDWYAAFSKSRGKLTPCAGRVEIEATAYFTEDLVKNPQPTKKFNYDQVTEPLMYPPYPPVQWADYNLGKSKQSFGNHSNNEKRKLISEWDCCLGVNFTKFIK
ncbi:RHS repeat-associated core domain-containing protein [Prosthecobacter sp.]|uniref:RHS repeat-associated core domain-containing protein n=1 Tax=Prosthecobacter sp. TaxID=1965333 RepID=UPI0037844835